MIDFIFAPFFDCGFLDHIQFIWFVLKFSHEYKSIFKSRFFTTVTKSLHSVALGLNKFSFLKGGLA